MQTHFLLSEAKNVVQAGFKTFYLHIEINIKNIFSGLLTNSKNKRSCWYLLSLNWLQILLFLEEWKKECTLSACKIVLCHSILQKKKKSYGTCTSGSKIPPQFPFSTFAITCYLDMDLYKSCLLELAVLITCSLATRLHEQVRLYCVT